jgi:hypothetical protein
VAGEPAAQPPSKPAASTASAASEAPTAAVAASGPLPTTTADKIAWCRRVDAKPS